MKIAMVCVSAGDTAVQVRRVSDLSAALARHGHQVTIYTSQAEGIDDFPLVGDGIVVTRGPVRAHHSDTDAEMLNDLGAFTQFLQDQWAIDPPDVAHAHHWGAGLATQLAARAQQIPTVQTFGSLVHSSRRPPTPTGGQTRRRLEALVARGSSWLIASHTDEMLELGQMGGRRSRISVVPYGIDIDLFSPQGAVLARGARHRILSVGRVAAGRGHDTVIASLRLIPNTELLVVGEIGGEPSRDAEAGRLKALAARFGVADRVHLVGSVAYRQMPALLRSADVVACIPQYDTFGIVALEAMSCAVPVVASTVGGLTDTVIPDVTGRLVSPNKPRECSDAILPILKHSFTRNSLGAAGRDRARSRYSWDRVANDTARAYHRLVPEVQSADIDRSLAHPDSSALT
jgi:D-inositol-3-phosphate glycosyltransferase